MFGLNILRKRNNNHNTTKTQPKNNQKKPEKTKTQPKPSRIPPTPKPSPDSPAAIEKIAASKLRLAKVFLTSKPEKAAERLFEIVKKYPDTKAAKEATTLLEDMGVDIPEE